MTIADAFKSFVKSLAGQEPAGDTVSEVIRDGADKIRNEVIRSGDIQESLVLKSSTAGSVKQFRVTIDDAGTLTTTEIA